MQIKGNAFGTKIENVDIYIEDLNCKVNSIDNNNIECDL